MHAIFPVSPTHLICIYLPRISHPSRMQSVARGGEELQDVEEEVDQIQVELDRRDDVVVVAQPLRGDHAEGDQRERGGDQREMR